PMNLSPSLLVAASLVLMGCSAQQQDTVAAAPARAPAPQPAPDPAPDPALLFAAPGEPLPPGGQTTVHATGRNAFSLPAANLEDAERTRFVIGNPFFKRNWVQAPASTTARDGLGPHFLARSCGGCHVQDGRAQPPDFHNPLKPQPFAGLLMRLSIPGEGPHGSPVPDPVYGDQFNTEGVLGVKGEGQL
ncbi:di-heme oxidoredictase family protein, partial [Bacillus cereus group sp. TH253LC]|uniref:di-heme oxidoredictase family protein n=1 Tax=Bacillus cereus group sp. TH253LC TaxID=3018043 RepID=UPI0022E43363